jgi:hypothetical protein
MVTASFQVLKKTVSPDRLKDWQRRLVGPPAGEELKKTEGKRKPDGPT